MVIISGEEMEIFMLSFWNNDFLHMSRNQAMRWRRQYLQMIDGDLLAPIQLWPKYVRRIFFQTSFPVGDSQTFILYLFMIGNGLSPFVASKWVMSSFAVCTWQRRDRLLRKRIAQIKWIHTNIRNNMSHWRYFDLVEREIRNF